MKVFTRFSIKNMLVIFLAIIMIIIGGIYSSGTLKMELMPNISFPLVSVITVYPGAGPDDVSDTVTDPVQKALKGIQGVKTINSTSNENVSIVMATFGYSKDMEKAQQEVQDAVNKLKFPDRAQRPNVSRMSYGSIPIVSYSVTANMTDEKLSEFINDKVTSELSGIKGVGSVSTSGLYTKNLYIRLDGDKLKAKGLTMQDVQQALAANDINYPIGTVDMDGTTIPLKVTKKITSLNDIKAIPLIIMPNSSKIMGEQMGEAIKNVYQAMGQIGSELGKQVAAGMGQMQSSIGGSYQAVFMLYNIQNAQSEILSQQSILKSEGLSAEAKAAAEGKLKEATMKLSALNNQFNMLMKQVNDQTQQSKAPKAQQKPSGLNNTAASTSGGAQKLEINTVFLGDLAEVVIDKPEGASYTRNNLKSTVMLTVYKSDDANSVQVAEDTKKKLEEISKNNSGVVIKKVGDSASYITKSVDSMVEEGLLGALFAILVIALFLRDLRATIIAVISIPLSVLIALIMMPRLGISLNIMSLSGMAVAVGRIVDDSIVVIENIYRRLQRRKNQDEEIIEDATSEVSSAITASTLTTVAVFLPLSFVDGMIGKIFGAFAWTVVICILASLLVAITVVPLMSKLMLTRKIPALKKESGRMENGYKAILSFMLSHRLLVVIISILLIAGSFFGVSKVGFQFLPPDKTNMINAQLQLPAGTSGNVTNEEALKMEKAFVDNKDVEMVASFVGDNSSEGNLYNMRSSNQATVMIIVKEGKDPSAALKAAKEKAKELSSDKVTWFVSMQDNMSGGARLEVVVNGKSIEDIRDASDKIKNKLAEIPELSNVSNNLSASKPEIAIKVDSEKAAQNGLRPDYVVGMVMSQLNYNKISTVQNNGDSIDVYLGLDRNSLNNIDEVKNIELSGMNGSIKVGDIADVDMQDGPVSILKRDGKTYASVSAEISAKDTTKVSSTALSLIDSIKKDFKPGITYSVGGSSEDINETFGQMGIAMLIAIFLVFITMVLTFKEGTAPLSILFSLPFAAVGALFALLITNHPLSMSGLVGILMLIGIVVTNAIVLVDRVQANRKKGMDIREALLEAGGVRLRPIIMTATATIMALIPMALGFSEGAIISEELGIVVIGGLTMSTVLTLIIVPVAYSLLEGLKLRITGRSKHTSTAAHELKILPKVQPE